MGPRELQNALSVVELDGVGRGVRQLWSRRQANCAISARRCSSSRATCSPRYAALCSGNVDMPHVSNSYFSARALARVWKSTRRR